MIQELLLLGACFSGQCKETTYTYLHHNPEQKAYVETVEKNLARYIPDGTAVVLAAARGEFTLNLNKNVSISYKNETVATQLVYGLEY